MRYLFIFLFFLGLILQSGCTSQARKTHLVFEKENATYGELHAALEQLKPIGHEGATHHQYKAVKTLRHIAKHMKDPAKREMGLRSLVFLAFFNDDRNVKKSSLSRLNAILDDGDQEMAYKVVIIDELKKIITAKTGYTDTDKSFLSGNVVSSFIYPDTGDREDALEFLTDRFEDFPEYLQYLSIKAFTEILDNPSTCYEMDDGACEEDDTEDQNRWKQNLQEQVGDWLEESDLSPMIKTSLVRMVEKSIKTEEEKENSPAKTLLKTWVNDNDIPQQTRDIIQTALDKRENSYPDLMDQDASKLYIADEGIRNLDYNDETKFWYANTEEILKNQLFIPGAIPGVAKITYKLQTRTVDFMQIPSEWVFYDGFSNDERSKELKEIIFFAVNEALDQGYLLTPGEDLMIRLKQNLTAASNTPVWALDRSLSVIAKMYPSLYHNKEDINYFVEFMTSRLSRIADIHQKRLYYYLLVEGMPYFRDVIEPAVCSSLKSTDLLTQQLVKVRVASLTAPRTLLTISTFRAMQNSGTPQTNPEKKQIDEDSAPYIQSFCEEDISGLKPKPIKLEIVREPET